MMKIADPGILEKSSCFFFEPSPLSKQLFFYPTWLGRYYCTSRYYIKRDRYQYMLLIYVSAGKFYCEYRGESYEAERGDILLLDCNEPHYYHARDGLEFSYIHYDGSNAQDITHYIQEQYGWHINKDNNETIADLLNEMLIFYESNGVNSVVDRSAMVYKLLEELLKPSAEEQQSDREINKVIRYIRANIDRQLTLQELADLVNLNPFYFSHYFKRRTEFSPLDYVINVKIDRAKSMLIRTTTPITEIAYSLGYASSTAFSNIFSRRVGQSPRAYRNYHTNRKS